MCRVITAGSVLQGDFTAQMKEEEGWGASNIQGASSPVNGSSTASTWQRCQTANGFANATVQSAYHADPASPPPPKHPLGKQEGKQEASRVFRTCFSCITAVWRNTLSPLRVCARRRLMLHHCPLGKMCSTALQSNFNGKSFRQICLIHTQIPGLGFKEYA